MIKNKISLLIYLFFYTNNPIQSTPVVEIAFQGLLGNRLFIFCIGKILAEKLNFKLYCPPIYGFPDTYEYIKNKSSNLYPTESILGTHDIDIEGIVSNHSLRNIKIEGYFQRYKYLQPYAEKIRNEWLKFDPKLINNKQNPNDIVIHIRSNKPYYLPFEYYKKALDSTSFDKIFICIDEPNSPYLENFKPYNPIIKSSRSLHPINEFKCIMG